MRPRETDHTMNPAAPAADAAPTSSLIDPKLAMGWMHTTRFLTTAAQLHHLPKVDVPEIAFVGRSDRKSTRLNSSHLVISYAVFCLKKKNKQRRPMHCALLYIPARNRHVVLLHDH